MTSENNNNNALAVQSQRSVPSVFDDFDQFEKALRMAEALSKTQLIPTNFQGRPEDCLIALDYSRRLGLPPTAVLPHLYVIGGRPSSSAQFMISLVNRSGLFTRIQWNEKIDGSVEFVANGAKKTLPNYSAVAWFEEIATGRRYESPIVDVKFALANGWLTKNDSKWQKMPEVMCRYRSASILIKTVAPELAMGMEFAEDAMDALDDGNDRRRFDGVDVRTAEAERAIEAEVIAQRETPENDNTTETRFYELRDRIETADSEGLRVLGREIADSGLPSHYLDELRQAFKARRAAIASENRTASAEEPSEKKQSRGSRKKSEQAEKELPETARAILERLTTSSSFTELSAAWFDAETGVIRGDIPSELYSDLHAAYKKRVAHLRADVKQAELDLFATLEADVKQADGDKDQKGWAIELSTTIMNQTDAAFIRTNLVTADEWKEGGALTPALHTAVVKYARSRIAAFFDA